MSNKEADTLVTLLEEFASSKKFIESAYFVEKITQLNTNNDSDIREIFLSWRKFYGRSRAMSSTHWHNFLRRIGKSGMPYGYVRGMSSSPYEMSYDHFRNMERLLLIRSNVDIRIKSIILNVIDMYEKETDLARRGELPITTGSISKIPNEISRTVIQDIDSANYGSKLSAVQIAGLMTVITDISVLFTTRDWGVAGTMSTIAGAFAAAGQVPDR